MKKKKSFKFPQVPKKPLIILSVLIVISFFASIFVKGSGKTETIKEVMRDAVLHEHNKMSLFGVLEVNPAVISAFLITAALLIFSAIVRIFVIPKFKIVPGKFQLAIESVVGYFKDLSQKQSPYKNKLLGIYIFSAGVYIFFSTLFELLGLQFVSTEGVSTECKKLCVNLKP